MKIFILLLFVVISTNTNADKSENHEFLHQYLAGTYHVIGKSVDSQLTYYGTVQLINNKNNLLVLRKINGKKISGTGHIEHSLANDEIQVLRIRFQEDAKKYEATYLWRSDFDNYARISGYVYQIGKTTTSPGMEALFIDPKLN